MIFWFQRTRSYFCDRRGNVICQSGWEKSQENENPLHPCSVPICRDGCNNGECKAPNYCTCDIGWTGLDCSTCLEKPGCQHGSCNEAFECNCDPEWFGSHCQTRKHTDLCTNLIKRYFFRYSPTNIYCTHVVRVITRHVFVVSSWVLFFPFYWGLIRLIPFLGDLFSYIF